MNRVKNFDKIVSIFLMIVLIGVPLLKLLSYCLYLLKLTDNVFVINQVYVLWVIIPPLILLYLVSILCKFSKITYVDIIIYTLMFLAIMSTISAVDTNTALYGEDKRNEGLLSLLSYYLIFLNSKNIKTKKSKKLVLNTFIGVGLFQAIYGILQVYTIVPFVKHYSKPYMAIGLCGNPNFYGSFMVMQTLLSISMFMLYKKKKYLFISIIFFINLCLANSTGPFLGFIIAYLFFVIVYYKKIKFKTILLVTVLLISTFFITDYTNRYVQSDLYKNYIVRNYTIKDEILDTINNKSIKDLGNGRIDIWNKSLPLIKEYPILGCGLDNFANVYPYNTGYLIYDKAHNIYLQIAITNGIPAIIIYCMLCLIAFIKGFKLKDNLYIAMYIAFIGYCIQGFANISVIDVAPSFFLILGLLYSENSNDLKES